MQRKETDELCRSCYSVKEIDLLAGKVLSAGPESLWNFVT